MIKELVNCATDTSSCRFDLGPLFFDGIKVWWIWWQVKQCVPRSFQGFHHILSFMKSSIVHDDNASRRQLGNEVLIDPGIENDGVHGCLKKAHGEQNTIQKCANHIRSPLRAPIMRAKTSFSFWWIASRSRHRMCKSRLINKDNWALFFCIFINFLAKRSAFFGVRFGVFEAFF